MTQGAVYLIAEAGVNHNGDFSLAKKLVDIVADSGADAVKFQTFVPENLVTKTADKADYQKKNGSKSQLEMLQDLALPLDAFAELAEYTKAKNLDFMTTAFDSSSLDFIRSVSLPKLKIPSGEITNLPFIIEHAQLRLPMILSTGMANLNEIEQALSAVYWGQKNSTYPKSVDQLMDFWKARTRTPEEITLLHCTSAYPAPADSINMNAISTLADHFSLPVGYSDHSLGNTASVLAIAKGATVIEKHVTLSKDMIGPDHQASMSPEELNAWVNACREATTMLGTSTKQTQTHEADVKSVARKSLVANKAIKKGSELTIENVTMKRPGGGRPPVDLFSLLGQSATKDYEPDDFIEE